MTLPTRCSPLVAGVLLCLLSSPSRVAANTQVDPAAVEQPRDPREEARLLVKTSLAELHAGEDAGSTAEKLEHYRKGLELAERAVALDDTSADAHYAEFANRGRILSTEGAVANPFNLLKLRPSLNRSLELDPNHAAALAARGTMYLRLPRLLGGDLEKAKADIERSLSIDPGQFGARMSLAEVYLALGRRDEATKLLTEARALAIERHNPRQQREAEEKIAELEGESPS